MILVSAGQQDRKSFDASTVFAMQLAQLGYEIAIDAALCPTGLSRGQRYDAAPFLVDVDEIEIDRVIVLDAANISPELMQALRRYDAPVSALGRFETLQGRIGAQAKIAYATGAEPLVADLGELLPTPILDQTIAPICGSATVDRRGKDRKPQLLLYMPPERLDEPTTLPTLDLLDSQPRYDLVIVTSSTAKKRILSGAGQDRLTVYSYAEIPPLTLAARCDVVAFLGDRLYGERMAHLATEAVHSGKIVIDCLGAGSILRCGAPVLRGPVALPALPAFVEHRMAQEDAATAQDHPWLKSNSFARLEDALNLTRPEPVDADHTPAAVFFPTNGNGLGHAQRCLLIADAMEAPAQFAAFPSCTTLIRDRGYDCLPLVQRSEDHVESYANDLINHLRFDASLKPGDHLIFDGGYVFESVLRAVLTKDLRATWIRRGLWQPGQINAKALEREKVFSQIIVPQEAFAELNAAYGFDANTHDVGPIVQRNPVAQADRSLIRDKLKARFDRDFDRLVVTMLGGGVASDRSAQLQTIAAKLDQRTDCLNLILVWPNSVVQPALYGWRNSRVVTSQNAARLAQAADLTISAVGYNSFHEAMYHAIPTIFLPQIAPFMDDQARRARAASDRGLATTVLPEELLRLGREIDAHLDGGKSDTVRDALSGIDLPTSGNVQAARLIEGLTA